MQSSEQDADDFLSEDSEDEDVDFVLTPEDEAKINATAQRPMSDYRPEQFKTLEQFDRDFRKKHGIPADTHETR